MKEFDSTKEKLLLDYAKYPHRRGIIELQLEALENARALFLKKNRGIAKNERF